MRYFFYLLLGFFVFLGGNTFAQEGHTLSGTVADEKGVPLKSATVFMSGTQKITMTDHDGRFTFHNILPGYFTVSVKMLGYVPYAKNVEVKDKPLDLNIALAINTTALKEVVIGSGSARKLYLEAFKEQFLGATVNGKSCVLLNPEAVNFTTNKDVLMADADQFLMVENPRLGYKIRYMLKNFWYNASTQMTNYEGDAIFEDLPGTEKQKQQWARNRAEAYAGSLVHFLRSVHNNSVLKEGFLAYKRYPQPANSVRNDLLYIDRRPVRFDTLVTPLDTSFAAFKAIPLYVIHDPKQAARIKDETGSFKVRGITRDYRSTMINFSINEVVIDRKGVFKDYTGMQFLGVWGMSRLGDKVPLEYQPTNE